MPRTETQASPSSPPSSPDTETSIHILLLDGASLSLNGNNEVRLERKAAGVLAYLSVEREAPRARLASLLWPAAPEATARNNLAQTLRRIRQITGSSPLVIGQAKLRLAENSDSDLLRLETARESGFHHQVANAAGELLGGYQYDDCPEFDSWLQGQRQRLASVRVTSIEHLANQAEAAGNFRNAITRTHRLLELDPYDEAHHRRLMRLLWLAGDRRAALAAYRRCRENLLRELGIQPSAETQALELAILKGEAAPRGHRREHRVSPPIFSRPPLVEREACLDLMESAWQRGRSLLVEGCGGYGKSRLMQEFLATKGRFYAFQGTAGDRNIPFSGVARAARDILRAFPGIRLPAWASREIGLIVPELDSSSTSRPLRHDRLRLHQALAELADQAAAAGLLRAGFDDIHLYDLASLNALTFLCAHLSDSRSPLQLVLCCRQNELSGPGRRILARGLARGNLAPIRLTPLSLAGIAQMLEKMDCGLAPMAGELHRHTGGNPFFALETLRTLHAEGNLEGGRTHQGNAPLPVPRKIKESIEARLACLSPHALQTLRLAAVAGENLDPSLAHSLLGLSEGEMGLALDELATANLLENCCFPHELARLVILEGMPEPWVKRLRERASAPEPEAGGLRYPPGCQGCAKAWG